MTNIIKDSHGELAEKKYVCGHYLAKYLPRTENWIYRIITNHQTYHPVVFTRKIIDLKSFPFEPILELYGINRAKLLYNFLIFKSLGFFPEFKRFCVDQKVNILHVHFGYHGIKSIALKNRLKIPMVCSFYGDDAFYWTSKRGYEEKFLRLFHEGDLILVLGAYMKNWLIKLGGPDNKIRIHHLGVNVDKIKFQVRNYPNSRPIRFLITSSFVQKKGIDIALKALGLIHGKFNFKAHIIGGGPLEQAIHELVTKLKLEGAVQFHGYQSYEYFLDLAYTCDVFLQASKTGDNNEKEGTPMVLADVMATGLPVVSTFHSDIPEIVINGENGYLAEENNIESFAKSIMKFVDNYEKWGTLSKKGRIHIEQNFNSKIQTDKLENMYSELL